MTRIVLFTALSGFFCSMVGDAVIGSMFDPVRDRRMDFLARYAAGVTGLYYPIKLWRSKTNNDACAFFGASFVFGLAVMAAGMFREVSR